jgi:CRISPR-associated protein Cmr1
VNAAIKDGERTSFSLAVPEAEAGCLQRALALINLYGTLGGRSRNGWGSFSLTPLEGTPALAGDLNRALTLPWKDALASDWPQALGCSEGDQPLIWQTEAFDDWKKVMVQLARTKIALRRLFLFPHERPDGQIHDRHWLSYPVTTHKVQAWDRQNLRLPNTLRFKVRPGEDGKGLRGVIFHVPCKPPAAFGSNKATLERVWQQVHAHLDASLKRSPA